MSKAPKIEMEGFANAVCVKAKNRNGKDMAVFRSDKVDGNYADHDVSDKDAFAEMIDPLKTYKYKSAFVGNGITERRSGAMVRPKQSVAAAPPSGSGGFQITSKPFVQTFGETFKDTFG